MEEHMLNWFEVAVTDFERAKKFYEAILEVKMETEEIPGYQMAYFPFYQGKPTGSISKGADCVPSTTGTLIYLNGNPDLSVILNKVEKAGGKILVPKSPITPEYGFFAQFIDTEGNKIGLHSEK